MLYESQKSKNQLRSHFFNLLESKARTSARAALQKSHNLSRTPTELRSTLRAQTSRVLSCLAFPPCLDLGHSAFKRKCRDEVRSTVFLQLFCTRETRSTCGFSSYLQNLKPHMLQKPAFSCMTHSTSIVFQLKQISTLRRTFLLKPSRVPGGPSSFKKFRGMLRTICLKVSFVISMVSDSIFSPKGPQTQQRWRSVLCTT